MKLRVQQTRRVLSNYVAEAMMFAALATGCAAAAEPEVGEIEKPEVATSQPQSGDFEGELLVSVTLSPTHTVNFWEAPDGRFGVSESGHMDLDRGQPTYAEMPDGALRLSAVYEHLMGNAAVPSDLETLRGVDRLVLEREAAQEGLEEAADGATPPLPPELQNEESEVSDANVIEKQAACNIPEFPPGWSWTIDGNNIAGDWCGSTTQHCRMNMSVTTSDWWRTRDFKAVGFAQDFCNQGRLRIWDWVQAPSFPCGNGAISSGIKTDVVIPPRTYVSRGWTNNGGTGCFDTKFWYYAQASKSSGPNGSRVGLVVKPEPCQPLVNCPAHVPQGCPANTALSCNSSNDCSGNLTCIGGCCGAIR